MVMGDARQMNPRLSSASAFLLIAVLSSLTQTCLSAEYMVMNSDTRKGSPNKVSGFLRAFIDQRKRSAHQRGHFDILQTRDNGSKVLVEIVGEDVEALEAALSKLEAFDLSACEGYLCSGAMTIDSIESIAKSTPEIITISPVLAVPRASIDGGGGSVVGGHYTASYADHLRDMRYNLTGEGITIGVLSDSFNCHNSSDVYTDDLPLSYTIVQEYDDCPSVRNKGNMKGGASDEGRAMMQLIHDIAPNARLAFHSVAGGAPVFAQAVTSMVDIGCDVIVDNYGYYTEPFFQDGIIAQVANQAVLEHNIPYFSAAGNEGRMSWEGKFRGSGSYGISGEIHEFLSSDGSTSQAQRITFSEADFGKVAFIAFQWDEPFYSASGPPGSSSDVDLFIYEVDGSSLKETRTLLNFNIGNDPIEFGSWVIEKNTYYLSFELFNGPSPSLMKWIIFGDATPVGIEFDTKSGTIFGHPNAASTASIGSANYVNTPRFGVNPAEQAIDSSAGSVPILFDSEGKRLPNPEYRRSPLVLGPDGSQTTFFGSKVDGTFRFYGTSAAASSVAALAGLVLEYNNGFTPCIVYEAFAETASDMDDIAFSSADEGYDFGTGYGYVNASAAMQYVQTPKNIRSISSSKQNCPYTGSRYGSRNNGNGAGIETAVVAVASIIAASLILAAASRFRKKDEEPREDREPEERKNQSRRIFKLFPKKEEPDIEQDILDKVEKIVSKTDAKNATDSSSSSNSDSSSTSNSCDEEDKAMDPPAESKSKSFDISVNSKDLKDVMGSVSDILPSVSDFMGSVSESFSQSGIGEDASSSYSSSRYDTIERLNSEASRANCVAHADYDFETVYTPRHNNTESARRVSTSKRLDMTGNINLMKESFSTLSEQTGGVGGAKKILI